MVPVCAPLFSLHVGLVAVSVCALLFSLPVGLVAVPVCALLFSHLSFQWWRVLALGLVFRLSVPMSVCVPNRLPLGRPEYP